jgi:hypothetical protein
MFCKLIAGMCTDCRDLRANLELAVDYVVELAASPESTLDSDYTSDSEDAPVVLCNVKLTSAVRKQLALSIRDLMQHGLMPVSSKFLFPAHSPFQESSAKLNKN